MKKIKFYIRKFYYFFPVKKYNYLNLTFSQEGEDRILHRFFEGRETGLYIDVGAHHPQRFSNTYLFYLKGWSGINIDAMPGSMAPFKIIRPRDVNIECGVAEKEGYVEFYIFDEPALNTFDKQQTIETDTNTNYKIKTKQTVKTKPLWLLLDEANLENKSIDFLTIDAEGMDLTVLKSNNWEKYRPEIVVIEEFGKDAHELTYHNYFNTIGYVFYARTCHTSFYKKVF